MQSFEPLSLPGVQQDVLSIQTCHLWPHVQAEGMMPAIAPAWTQAGALALALLLSCNGVAGQPLDGGLPVLSPADTFHAPCLVSVIPTPLYRVQMPDGSIR